MAEHAAELTFNGEAVASPTPKKFARTIAYNVLPLAGSMVTFRTSIMPHDVLFKRLFYSHGFRCRPVSEQKLNALRVSMHVFNTPAECDALAETAADILRRV